MRFLMPVFLCVLFSGCYSEGDCIITTTNYMHIQFRKFVKPKLDTALTIDSVLISGTKNYLLNPGLASTPPTGILIKHSEIILPLDIDSTITKFVMFRTYLNRSTKKMVYVKDTLIVSYSKQSKLLSPTCGVFSNYQNLKIVRSTFPAKRIIPLSTSLIKNPSLSDTSAYAVNFQILF